MQNKKAISIFIFLPILSVIICLNLFGQTEALNNTDKSIFFKKNKPPVLTPEKKYVSDDQIPKMELLTEQIQVSTKDEQQVSILPEMPLIEAEIQKNIPQPSDNKQKKAKFSRKKIESDDDDEDDEDCIDKKADENVYENEEYVKTNKQSKTEFTTEAINTKQCNEKQLSFGVENTTGQTIYVACFAYIKKRAAGKWRWHKSPVQKLEDNKKIEICTDEIEDAEDRADVFGYLGVFEDLNDAEESTYEMLSDKKKIDLDLIAQLKDKTVKIEIEKYGFRGSFYDYDFVKTSNQKNDTPELDFVVENKTGKAIWTTCFVYEKKAKSSWLAKKTTESWTDIDESRDDMSIWRFDKTPVIKIKSTESGIIDVDTIIEPRDRTYVRGYLVIFDEDERQLAENATYELLPENTKKLDLGRLVNIKNKKIEIYAEKYGTSDFIDYTVQPAKRINLDKITNKIG
ncbi:MAG: hypothetical protein US49_C0007G0002 [candidate division TM6 bacterium GW2011_GWF2_37_49]|nr:MAG: hypothetical protein US49_C0007G0002 [candidate division TM6 bacterium GW2011_GWF2_37_49]